MFEAGREYKRSEIHAQLGGQDQGGMSTPAEFPVVLLFTGPSGEEYGYEDSFRPNGEFWYTGEGQFGDMKFTRSNKALRDHQKNGERVFLFEETRRSHVVLVGEMECLGHHIEQRPDKAKAIRNAIVFHLGLIAGNPAVTIDAPDNAPSEKKLRSLSRQELRTLALARSRPEADVRERSVIARVRSNAVREYALQRAGGRCEGCQRAAPFRTKNGPFLEVHHVYRVSDGGPDHPASVVAICPNCHREVHYGTTGSELNARLIKFLRSTEGLPDVPALPEGIQLADMELHG